MPFAASITSTTADSSTSIGGIVEVEPQEEQHHVEHHPPSRKLVLISVFSSSATADVARSPPSVSLPLTSHLRAHPPVSFSASCSLPSAPPVIRFLYFSIFRNGDVYAGEYFADKMHGFGVYRFANGHQYEGAWHEGRRQRLGMYTFRNGETQSGHWNNGILDIPSTQNTTYPVSPVVVYHSKVFNTVQDQSDIEGESTDVSKTVATLCGQSLSTHIYRLRIKYLNLKSAKGEEYARSHPPLECDLKKWKNLIDKKWNDSNWLVNFSYVYLLLTITLFS
ncbi:hypothetical protein ACSBR1_031375 [Camellia fascicularis]